MPYFPSCGGTAEADPSPALERFLADPPASFLQHLRSGQRRAYVAARSVLWVSPAMLFFQRRGLPFYLVETNAGAGLNLAADAVTRPKKFDASLVAARVGLDAAPLDITDTAQRRWLTAGLWPDNAPGIAELDAAIDAVQARARAEASFLQLVPCPPEKAAAFLAKNVPADDPDVGLLLFNMGTTTRMTDEEYAVHSTAIAGLLRAWGDRGLWVEVENVRGETFSTTHQVRAHRVVDGALRSLTMTSFDLDAGRYSYSEASPAFLDVP